MNHATPQPEPLNDERPSVPERDAEILLSYVEGADGVPGEVVVAARRLVAEVRASREDKALLQWRAACRRTGTRRRLG